MRSRNNKGRVYITDAQFNAGERLRYDFTLANMTPNVTVNLNAPVFSKSQKRGSYQNNAEDLSNIVLSAKYKVRQSLSAVGPELSGVLIEVCCHINGIEVAENNLGWPKRSGKVVLSLALTSLARHYKML